MRELISLIITTITYHILLNSSVPFVPDSKPFVCTFEDEVCPMHNLPSPEYWTKVDGSLSSTKDNTLNHGTNERCVFIRPR